MLNGEDIVYFPSAFQEGKTSLEFVEKATLPRLIEKLTPPHSQPHSDHVNIIVMTVDTFTTPKHFLELLWQRSHIALLSGGQPLK